MYADDILLLSNSKYELQKTLDACNKYFNKWKLTLNTDKTKIVIFNTISEKSEMFFYGKKQIDVVTQHRYLGINIDKHMSIKSHSRSVSESI